MTQWTPLSKRELYELILKSETDLNGELMNFWELIKMEPKKWTEKTHGDSGDGFWVVAICGTKIIWYNDIEEGFNISNYTIYGHINEYNCNQDNLSWAVSQLFGLMKMKN